MSYTLNDFDYKLPPDLIAQTPLNQRSGSRLLEMNGRLLTDRHFTDLPSLLVAGDVLVLNDTRVLQARLLGKKTSGGAVEVLVERIISTHEVLAQVRASKPLRAGGRLLLEDAASAEVVDRVGEFYQLRFEADAATTLERYGRLPLPPYIRRAATAKDEARYQTVYARNPGSAAAPTAGLHFDDALLNTLRTRGIQIVFVTLHVGAGTFQPVRTQNIAMHRMHAEHWHLSETTAATINAAKSAGRRIIAVGTTTLRTLESAALASNGLLRKGAGETDLFITPGFDFQVVDLLITNFHLPQSTLLMLISAFAGMRPTRAAYRYAISQGYRFFSYGDAMLIHKSIAQNEESHAI